jgi:hypothetical protein
MPRLSLWRENKSSDYKFFNNRIREQFTIGGTDLNVHKYLGSGTGGETTPTTPEYETQSEQNIQDLLFLENRDRKYDPDIYSLRGHYNVNDMDFDLSQFGLFLQNDTLFITVHLTDMIERLGRKLMSGDVLEIPHLRDDWPLDATVPYALRKFYVIQDATRAAEGYSPTWWPHLWRVKATPLVNSQEYQDLLGNLTDEETGNPLGDLLSTYNKEIAINDAVVDQALLDVPAAGYDTSDLYTLPIQTDGSVNEYEVVTADSNIVKTDSSKWTADRDLMSPVKSAYDGYLTGDGLAPNGFPVQTGIVFPADPEEGDFVLRLDFYPNRLFRYNGAKWVRIEDDLRYSYLPKDSKTQIGSFINNNREFTTRDGQTFTSKQKLSDAIKPKADH